MDHTLGVEVPDFLPRRHAVQALIVGHDELHVFQQQFLRVCLLKKLLPPVVCVLELEPLLQLLVSDHLPIDLL